MGVYICPKDGQLIDIDEINVYPDDRACDCGNTQLIEVTNFESFLNKLGYYPYNELCRPCQQRLG